jgi:glycosyltransferase involved in cell wall biosynthesis
VLTKSKIIIKNRMKKKIIFFINSYTDYNNDFFLELKSKYKLKIILLKNNEATTYYVRKKNQIYSKVNIENIAIVKNILERFKPNCIIIGGYKFPKSKFIIEYAKKNKINYYFWLERIKSFWINKIYFYIFFKKKVKSANGIFAIGNYAYRFYRMYNKNTVNLPYSINTNVFIANKHKEKKLNILYVGQLIKRKGIDLILNAFELLDETVQKNIKLTFVGSGKLKQNIVIKKKIYKSISIVNFVNRKKITEIYSKNNVFIFPSLYDGWGVAAMEAMASGLALIISKNCGLAELLTHNRNGLVIKPSTKAIFNSIMFYYKNRAKIKKYGENNKVLIKKTNLNLKINSKTFKNYLNSHKI